MQLEPQGLNLLQCSPSWSSCLSKIFSLCFFFFFLFPNSNIVLLDILDQLFANFNLFIYLMKREARKVATWPLFHKDLLYLIFKRNFYFKFLLAYFNLLLYHSSLHLTFIWIFFENVMSLHRCKAVYVGLFNAGRVNEWVVTEKLGNMLKTKPDVNAAKNFQKFWERYSSNLSYIFLSWIIKMQPSQTSFDKDWTKIIHIYQALFTIFLPCCSTTLACGQKPDNNCSCIQTFFFSFISWSLKDERLTLCGFTKSKTMNVKAWQLLYLLTGSFSWRLQWECSSFFVHIMTTPSAQINTSYTFSHYPSHTS